MGKEEIKMNMLTKKILLTRLRDPNDDLKIVPLLDPEKQIDHGAINLRLGTQFILTRKTRHSLLSPKNINEHSIRQYQRRISLCFGQEFIMHPRQFVLAVTLEFISMPSDLCGFVLVRSRYGRAGLITATATYVHPHWRGCLTLELVNYGEVPLELTCGSQIAQLVLSEAYPVEREKKPSSIAVEPQFPAYDDDSEWKILATFR